MTSRSKATGGSEATSKGAWADSSPLSKGYRAMMVVEPGLIATTRPFSNCAVSEDCSSIESFGSLVRSIAEPSGWIARTLSCAGYRVVAVGLSGRILRATVCPNEDSCARAARFAMHSRA